MQRLRALGGLAYVLGNLAPLYLMCDPGSIQGCGSRRSPVTKAPTVVGFSQRLFELHDTLLTAALELVAGCRCPDGCPARRTRPGHESGHTAVAANFDSRMICLLVQDHS
jgi:DEAD/DEAH box helicase domain-containing protein